MLKIISFIFIFILFAGCESNSVEVYEYQNESRLDHVYFRKGVDFSPYRSILIDPVSVWYPDASAPRAENVEKAKSNLARGQTLFKEMIDDVLDDIYPLTDKPGADVLRIHAEFVDLRSIPVGGAIPSEFSGKKFRTRPGHITLVVELHDSLSGEVLARAADLGNSESRGGDGEVDWDAIESDFRHWAMILRDWLDKVHNG
jgi:hypothetical protein